MKISTFGARVRCIVMAALALIAAPALAQQASPALGLDRTGTCRSLSVHDVGGGPASVSLGCINNGQFFTGPALDLRSFSADATGHDPSDDQFDAALTAARASGRPITGVGVFTLARSHDIRGVSIIGSVQTYTRQDLNPLHWGFVLQTSNPTDPMFVSAACGATIRGVVFYDTLQPGTGLSPVARPPFFAINSQCVDFTFEDNVVVNAYDLFAASAASTIGDWRIVNNRIYAVHWVYDFAGAVPESLLLANNFYTPGIWQGQAFYGNGGMLAKWTALNGAVVNVRNTGFTVDGIASNNELVFAYRSWANITSGTLQLTHVTGPIWDGVLQPIVVSGTGAIEATISNGYSYAVAYGSTTTVASAFSIAGAGGRTLTLSGMQIRGSAGTVLDVQSSAGMQVDIIGGDISNWAIASPGLPGVVINASNADISFRPSRMNGINNSTSVGVVATAARMLRIDSQFVGLTNAATIASGVVGLDTSVVISTGGTKSITNASSGFTASGKYDKP